MGNLEDIKRRAGGHDLGAKIIPGHRIARMQNYRNEKGERLGMPEKPSDAFEITAGLGGDLLDGPLTGFGTYLDEKMGSERNAGHTVMPEGNVAEQDLAPDKTPGGGTEIDDETYEDISDDNGKLVARRTISQWKEDLEILKVNFKEAQRIAQVFENEGRTKKANIFDDKSLRIAERIRSLRSKISARVNYEHEMASYQDTPSNVFGGDDFE